MRYTPHNVSSMYRYRGFWEGGCLVMDVTDFAALTRLSVTRTTFFANHELGCVTFFLYS